MDAEPKTCCSPSRGQTLPNADGAQVTGPINTLQDAVPIPSGTALIGTNSPLIAEDGEGPLRRKKVRAFQISATTITNASFSRFVEETAYVTEAEQFGWSFVFFSDVAKAVEETRGVVGTEWWRRVDGANWRNIYGPNTAHLVDPDHPVVQVSWADATAFAKWCGGRLPSEVEWEHAARGGLNDVRYPWGEDEPDDENIFPCNIWQGHFPGHNTGADGWKNTAPAESFGPNGYGLFNMVGNVWEWTAEPFRIKSLKKNVAHRMNGMRGFKLLKGGSYLCHRSYCHRYRISARTGNSPESTTPHQGFRVVWEI